jgi:hypothetical protein
MNLPLHQLTLTSAFVATEILLTSAFVTTQGFASRPTQSSGDESDITSQDTLGEHSRRT